MCEEGSKNEPVEFHCVGRQRFPLEVREGWKCTVGNYHYTSEALRNTVKGNRSSRNLIHKI